MKKTKPITAWALTDSRGMIIQSYVWPHRMTLYRTRSRARYDARPGEKFLKVEIRPAPRRCRAKPK